MHGITGPLLHTLLLATPIAAVFNKPHPFMSLVRGPALGSLAKRDDFISPDGICGQIGPDSFMCAGSAFGDCCSLSQGLCGTEEDGYCDEEDCDPDYGECGTSNSTDPSSSPTASPTTPTTTALNPTGPTTMPAPAGPMGPFPRAGNNSTGPVSNSNGTMSTTPTTNPPYSGPTSFTGYPGASPTPENGGGAGDRFGELEVGEFGPKKETGSFRLPGGEICYIYEVVERVS
ncbi:MAG: hypothetical protein M1831_003408 [Alyxoria varia]|nr:MAG: hypothetical protein M1831_003408 [Alyxoria varia]